MMAERDVIVSHTTIMRWVLRYVPGTSADGLALLDLRVGHGVWTKRLSPSEAVGITYFEGWTKMESPSDLCSAMIATWSLRRHFSEQLSPMDGSHGLPRSTSMGTRQPFEVCDYRLAILPFLSTMVSWQSSGTQQCLDGASLIHRTVSFRDLFQRQR
jgi:hypothetical protein